MRTIKFKAKRVDNGEWIFGDLIQWHDKKRAAITPPNGTMWMTPDDFEVIPETVGQFTGLLDKNGKEIYEGDRVTWGQNGQEKWHRYAVVSINPDIQFEIYKYVDSDTMTDQPSDGYVFHFGRFVYQDTGKYFEIIGNIHDTKED